METKNLDIFSEIYLDSDSEYCSDSDSDIYFQKPLTKHYRPSPRRLEIPLESIDFEKYVQENYGDKVKLLNRDTFKQITRLIIIFFNHFNEKCAYHLGSLDIIAADLFDIDILKSKRCSIESFCEMTSPERMPTTIYAIDEQKRVHEHFSEPQTLECLTILCENLLKGSLSQPIPEKNSTIVKICVHDNYRELVADSKKHVLLIVNYDDYADLNLEREPYYEIVAEKLEPYNVDVVYLNGDTNYRPFELGITCYTTILFIPHNDKTNFVNPVLGPDIVNDVISYLKDPQPVLEQIKKDLRIGWYVPLNITPDFNIDFKELPQYLEDNCRNYVKVFDREDFQKSKDYIIIALMDFSNGKCSGQQLKWIDQIYQVSVSLGSHRKHFIADYQDIDVINIEWKRQDFIENSPNKDLKPKVYGVDLHKNKFVLNDFKTAASLFYFAFSLTAGELYKSENWPLRPKDKLVKTCIADSLNLCISSIKKDIVLAIYYSNTKKSEEFLQYLEELAGEMKKSAIKFMKIDARLNYITLELEDNTYPILYFIPEKKSKITLFKR